MDHVDIAIIGAGMTGLTCGRILQQAGYQVTILEKSRGVGGRLATRRLPNARVDHGTCYISPKGELFQQFIQELTNRGIVQAWTDTVYELSTDGRLQFPSEQIVRYVAPEGMSAIAKFLAPNLDIRFSQRVIQLDLIDSQWQLTLEPNPQAANLATSSPLMADAVVVTSPAPQAAELLAPLAGTVLASTFVTQMQSVDFSPCISVMAGYSAECLQNWQTQYAGVKAIVAHNLDLAWIGLDSSKRISPLQPVFVIQSNADFAAQYLDEPDLTPVGQSLLHSAAGLLAPWLAQPEWMQVHRWRYAFANCPLSDKYLSADTIAPLVCAGDWCDGMRVESAFLSGIETALFLNQQLSHRPIPQSPFW